MAYSVFYSFPYYIKAAVGCFAVCETGDEDLLDVGFVGKCGFTQYLRTGRNIAQVHQRQPFFLYFFNDDAQDGCPVFFIFRKKKQSRSILPFFRNRDALQQDELVRYLQHDACTVSGLVVGTFRSAVTHILQNFQCGFNQFVGFTAMNVYQHPHTASIVLVGGIVQAQLHGLSLCRFSFFAGVKMLFFLHFWFVLVLYYIC